eukprot:gene17162-biopygen7641
MSGREASCNCTLIELEMMLSRRNSPTQDTLGCRIRDRRVGGPDLCRGGPDLCRDGPDLCRGGPTGARNGFCAGCRAARPVRAARYRLYRIHITRGSGKREGKGGPEQVLLGSVRVRATDGSGVLTTAQRRVPPIYAATLRRPADTWRAHPPRAEGRGCWSVHFKHTPGRGSYGSGYRPASIGPGVFSGGTWSGPLGKGINFLREHLGEGIHFLREHLGEGIHFLREHLGKGIHFLREHLGEDIILCEGHVIPQETCSLGEEHDAECMQKLGMVAVSLGNPEEPGANPERTRSEPGANPEEPGANPERTRSEPGANKHRNSGIHFLREHLGEGIHFLREHLGEGIHFLREHLGKGIHFLREHLGEDIILCEGHVIQQGTCSLGEEHGAKCMQKLGMVAVSLGNPEEPGANPERTRSNPERTRSEPAANPERTRSEPGANPERPASPLGSLNSVWQVVP